MEVNNQQTLNSLQQSIRDIGDGLQGLLEKARGLKDQLNQFVGGEASGTGNVNGNETDLENAADSVEQPDLVAPVLEELHRGNTYFMQCLYVLGAILVGGVGAAAVPCGYQAISLVVSVPLVMLIFGGTHIWKVYMLRRADTRRASLLRSLAAPFMVDMGTALLGAVFFLMMFVTSSVMKNCGVKDPPGTPPHLKLNPHNLAERI